MAITQYLSQPLSKKSGSSVIKNEATITKITPGSSGNAITIPETIQGHRVTSIGKGKSVVSQSGISSVTIPSSVTSIGPYAFSKCTSLKSINIPSGIKTLEASTFAYCSGLTTIKIPETVTQLKNSVFKECTSLKSIWIPNTITKVGSDVFSNCTSLTVLNGRSAVTSVKNSNGVSKPQLVNVESIRQTIARCFGSSINVGFIDTYCTKMCEYVVNTETQSWMSAEQKAKKLYHWINVNANYTKVEASANIQTKFLSASALFLSHGVYGTGEVICQGFAKAYTMLLSQADIESYIVSGNVSAGSHSWNIVNINGRYYQCDVTAEDGSPFAPLADNAGYTYFMKSNVDMYSLHGGTSIIPSYYTLSDNHPLLSKYTNGENAIKNLA